MILFNSSNVIIIGEIGVLKTTVANVKSISIGGKLVTSIVKASDDVYSFVFPTLVDNKTTALGSVTAIVTGSTIEQSTVDVVPNSDYSFVELKNPINATKTGIVYDFNPVAKDGDYIIYPIAKNNSIDAHANLSTDIKGFKTYWHIEKLTSIARKFVVTTG